MPSWQELERRFNELEQGLQFSRIDGQTGAAGEHWRIAGPADSDAVQRFEALAQIASAQLLADFRDAISRFPEVAAENDPVRRWYKALQYIGGRFEHQSYAEQLDTDGSSAGLIFLGSIDRPAAASATLCLRLAAQFPEQEPPYEPPTPDKSWFQRYALPVVLAVIAGLILAAIL